MDDIKLLALGNSKVKFVSSDGDTKELMIESGDVVIIKHSSDNEFNSSDNTDILFKQI